MTFQNIDFSSWDILHKLRLWLGVIGYINTQLAELANNSRHPEYAMDTRTFNVGSHRFMSQP
jgi:hypothetical protein